MPQPRLLTWLFEAPLLSKTEEKDIGRIGPYELGYAVAEAMHSMAPPFHFFQIILNVAVVGLRRS